MRSIDANNNNNNNNNSDYAAVIEKFSCKKKSFDSGRGTQP